MKKIYLSLFLFLSLFSANAQDLDTTVQKRAYADKLFNKFDYVEAAYHYKKLTRSRDADYYIFLRLADCYYNMFNTVESAKYYAKAIELNPNVEAQTYFNFAQMLKASGRYNAANKIMKKFADLEPDDSRSVEFLKEPNYIPRLRSQEALFTFLDSGMNSAVFSDFAGILTKNNKFYFASSRSDRKKKYGWNAQPYLDIFEAEYDIEEEEFLNIKPLKKLNNKKYHDGPVTVTEDEQTMYFASESFREKQYQTDKVNRLQIGKVGIFRAKYLGDDWGNIEPVPFNSGEYNVSNPSISLDGSMLYFSSDMPGGIGGMDIWKVAINEDGTYGEPENLGERVNTEGRESFPFICEDERLYFASDALKGFGGLDIYRINLNSKRSKATNLGDPINTPKDDFGLAFYPSKNIGFLSTNRVGRDDIYKVRPICVNEYEFTITDQKSGETLKDVQISILDHKNNVIETRYTDNYGIVNYEVDCERNYSIQVEKEDYAGISVELERTKNGQHPIEISLRPVELIVLDDRIKLEEIYFEYNKSNITQKGAFELNKIVDVMRINPDIKVKIESHTDSRGSAEYNLELSNNRAQSTLQYIVSKGISKDRLNAKGYGENMPRIDCGTNCSDKQNAINRRSEFIISKK